MIKAKSFNNIYPKLLNKIVTQGEIIKGTKTIEVSPFVFQVSNPLPNFILFKFLNFNYPSLIMKRLQILNGTADIEALCFYDPSLKNKIDPLTGLYDGAYGPRIKPQMDYIYCLLRRDSTSRRAIISIYNQRDQNKNLTFDVPSTISLQFLLRKQKLHLICYMRSNDFWNGLPFDIGIFSFLQEVMASWLKVKLGNYIHFVGSAHIYLKDLQKVKKFLKIKKRLLKIPYKQFQLDYRSTFKGLKDFFKKEKLIRYREKNFNEIKFNNSYFQWCWDLLHKTYKTDKNKE
jgi:thymidylate synthase